MTRFLRDLAIGVVGGCIVGLVAGSGANALVGLWVGLGAGGMVLVGLWLFERRRRKPEPARASAAARTPVKPTAPPATPRLLNGDERDELRALIAEGDALDAERAAPWLDQHGHERHARRVRSATSSDDVLQELHVTLSYSVPAGITPDSTPGEAVERWMEIQGFQRNMAAQIRERHEQYERKLTADRLGLGIAFSGGFSGREGWIEFPVKLTNDGSGIARGVVVRGYLDNEQVAEAGPVDVPVEAEPVTVNLSLRRPEQAQLAPELNHRPVFHGRPRACPVGRMPPDTTNTTDSGRDR